MTERAPVAAQAQAARTRTGPASDTTAAGAMFDDSPRQSQQRALAEQFHGSSLQMARRSKVAQLFGTAPPERLPASRPNATGLPDGLKTGVESLAGMSLDHVKVHYNSSQPAQLNALAYAQGSDIHVGPGQERHLPHEAWHVVQQAQGRVRPLLQMQGGMQVNDDVGLEAEADVMGARALSVGATAPGVRETMGSFAPMRSPAVMQAAWGPRPYTVSDGARTLQMDDPGVTWGGTAGPGNYAAHTVADARAILFETMCRDVSLIGLRDRLSQPASLWDTGLTVVINRAYTPSKIYDGDGKITKENSTLGNTLAEAKNAVDGLYGAATAGWNGMAINVVKAVWERREVKRGVNAPALEQVAGSVPYSTFRVLAATSPGAGQIEAALATNHDPSQIWRKMGDDDMPYVAPNIVGPETGALAEVEQSAVSYNKPTMVTFGYNLVTAGTVAPITGILQGIYAKEMALRDAIAALGAPMYPSEPTTFYQPRHGGSVAGPWAAMEAEAVGGSGQQLEGAKLARALRRDTGYNHVVYHTIAVDTGAGARNDALIALLNGWYNNGAGDITTFSADRIEDCINGLDQSALKHDEYLKKVIGNLDVGLPGGQQKKIEELVRKFRKEAAQEALATLAGSIPAAVTQGFRNQRYLAAWASTATDRNARYTPAL